MDLKVSIHLEVDIGGIICRCLVMKVFATSMDWRIMMMLEVTRTEVTTINIVIMMTKFKTTMAMTLMVMRSMVLSMDKPITFAENFDKCP
jgi:hypothetical protein